MRAVSLVASEQSRDAVMGRRAERSALAQLCHFLCHHLSDGQTLRSAFLPNEHIDFGANT